MGLLSASLFSPEIKTDHPVTVTPVVDVADGNPMTISDTDPLDDRVTNAFRGEESHVGVSTQLATEAYDVSWEAVRGAASYRIYGSVSPTRKDNLLAEDIKDTEWRFIPPVITEVAAYFFWVSAVAPNGQETYLSEEPASLMSTRERQAFDPAANPMTSDPCFFPGTDQLNCSLKDAFTYIRKANRLQLEMGGEPALLYLRRHAEDKPWGIPCSCTDKRDVDDSDPDYQGRGRCKLCFGTGIFGGFYPAIQIAIRYGNKPDQLYKHTARGLELSRAFNTYMLWAPVVRPDDVIVRLIDGSRYTVSTTKPDISFRGARLHQEFDLTGLEKTDIRMEITDAAIARSLQQVKVPSHFRGGFKIFG